MSFCGKGHTIFFWCLLFWLFLRESVIFRLEIIRGFYLGELLRKAKTLKSGRPLAQMVGRGGLEAHRQETTTQSPSQHPSPPVSVWNSLSSTFHSEKLLDLETGFVYRTGRTVDSSEMPFQLQPRRTRPHRHRLTSLYDVSDPRVLCVAVFHSHCLLCLI